MCVCSAGFLESSHGSYEDNWGAKAYDLQGESWKVNSAQSLGQSATCWEYHGSRICSEVQSDKTGQRAQVVGNSS